MSLEMWTPARGTDELIAHFGAAAAFAHLTRLLAGEVRPNEYTRPPYAEVLRCIGNGHAKRLLQGESGERLAYWPRVWAARSLAYLGQDEAASWLLDALLDPHWRVRMTAAQTLGRLGIAGQEEALCALLADEHERVRAAAAVALGRTGNEYALGPLQEAVDDVAEGVRERADRALAWLEKRLEEGS